MSKLIGANKLEDYPFDKVADGVKDIEELIINVIKHELDRMVMETKEEDGDSCSYDDFFGFSNDNYHTIMSVISTYEQLNLDIFKGASNIYFSIASPDSLKFDWEHYNDDHELIFNINGSYIKKVEEYKNWR